MKQKGCLDTFFDIVVGLGLSIAVAVLIFGLIAR